MSSKSPIYNKITTRFLPFPESAAKCLEPEAKKEDFKMIKQLGAGTYGKVYLVEHKITKAKYAMKIIDKKNAVRR